MIGMEDLKYAKEVFSLREITASELRTGEHDGRLFLKLKDFTVVISMAYAGGVAYMATFYKDGVKTDYVEDTKITTVKNKIKKYNPLVIKEICLPEVGA